MNVIDSGLWGVWKWKNVLEYEVSRVKKPEEESKKTKSKKKRILVVDDEWSILQLLKFKLSQHGYDVITAKNEKEFWDTSLNDQPDLLILDVWLGSKMGPEIYESLLSFGFDADIPVIFMTALMSDHPPKYSAEGGRYALFGKPFDFDHLLDEVNKLTRRAA